MRWTFLPFLILPACDFGHLGNPLLLPIHAANSAAENALYDARRAEVSGVLAANPGAWAGMTAADPRAQALFDTARIPPANQAKVLAEIAALPLGAEWLERATVIAMVHGG